MSFIADCLADDRDQRNETARQQSYESRFVDGENDAAFGRLPAFADEVYLEGYFAQLKKLPKDAEGRIQHYSPRQHFAFGWMDGVGERTDGESNYEYDF